MGWKRSQIRASNYGTLGTHGPLRSDPFRCTEATKSGERRTASPLGDRQAEPLHPIALPASFSISCQHLLDMATDSTSSPHGLGALTTKRNDANLSRRERKRASDRMSQQASRAKTKAYIAHLERSVTRLTEAQSNSGSNVSEQLREQFDEIASLKQALAQISKLATNTISKHTADDDLDQSICSTPRPPAASSEKSSRHVRDAYNPACHPHQESLEHLYPALDLSCGDTQRDYFQAFSQALDTIESDAGGHAFSGPEIDDDINIRAVLDGWDVARAKNPFDIGWLMLRAVDEGFLWRGGAVERMAILRVIRSMLMVVVHAEQRQQCVLRGETGQTQPTTSIKQETPCLYESKVRNRQALSYRVLADSHLDNKQSIAISDGPLKAGRLLCMVNNP